MRLHFNPSNGIFSVRRRDRSTVVSTERHSKVPLVGTTFPLAPRAHLLVTASDFRKAMSKARPVLSVVVTRFPRIRLFIKWLKEVTR